MMNKKGATSVFLILLMLVLMVLGLTVLTMTLSNQRLSEKKQSWTQAYYDLEADAAELLYSVDDQINEFKNIAEDEEMLKEMIEATYETYGEDELSIYLIADQDNQYIAMTLAVELDLNKSSNYRVIDYQHLQDPFEYDDLEFGVPFIPGE